MPDAGQYTNGAVLHTAEAGRAADHLATDGGEGGRVGGAPASAAGGGGDGASPVFSLSASDLAAIVAAAQRHGDQAPNHGDSRLVHGDGRKPFDRSRAVAKAAVRRTARGDLVWPVLGIFLALGLWQGLTSDPAPSQPQAFMTYMEDADPFASIAEMR